MLAFKRQLADQVVPAAAASRSPKAAINRDETGPSIVSVMSQALMTRFVWRRDYDQCLERALRHLGILSENLEELSREAKCCRAICKARGSARMLPVRRRTISPRTLNELVVGCCWVALLGWIIAVSCSHRGCQKSGASYDTIKVSCAQTVSCFHVDMRHLSACTRVSRSFKQFPAAL
jgi:hypothetical protein